MSTRVIIVLICTGVIILPSYSLMALCYYFCKQIRKKKESSPASPMGVLLSNPTPPMELDRVVLATENFSTCNIIGRGGFGIIYKGTLLDGQVIAVKRLLKRSAHGMDGIKNELDLLVQLQHINLVRLLGYCFEGNQVLLIYEYLENSSLDTHIFDKTRSCYLNWDMRLQIAKGIARGLLYLHQDSRSRIIHRDLKPSNVLLDKDMVPNISDFGLATLFGRDETEANTREIVGTYGYMSPEYVADGAYSTGSDVFSFGVLYLEILSGKRNRDFFNNDETLINYIWRNWWAGNGLGVVDPVILNSSDFRTNQVLRCIQIGLLCVQDYPEARPAMSSVIIMLESETIEIDEPSQPGYFVRSDQSVASSSSWTVNEITQSIIQAR